MNYNNSKDLFQGLSNESIAKRTFAEINTKKITYGELCSDINKLCILFDQNGLKKGDRIILSTKDDYYTSLFFLAFLRYGLVTVFLDADVPVKRAKAIIEKSDPIGIVMDESLFTERNIIESTYCYQLKIKKAEQKKGLLFKKLLGNKKSSQEIETTDFPAIIESIDNRSIDLIPVSNSDLAYIIFTSGTTSEPKGVMITHENLFAHLSTLTTVYGLNKDSRLLNILMLYHADGCIQGPLLTIYNQATWIRPFSFDLSKIDMLFNSVYKYRVSHFITVPTMLSFMGKFSEGYEDSFQTEDFKFIISCASKLESKLWSGFEGKFQTKLLNVYGLTETVAGSLFSGITYQTGKLGTEGLAVDCDAKIIKEDGIEAKVNEAGDLYLKGKHLFVGYFNDIEATEKVLNSGWLNTGDIAFKDNEGFYNITGRSKNTINSGGVNIYPEQVTEMVNTHPNVLESICLGIADETFGEKLVCAYVVKAKEVLEKATLISFLRPLLEQNQIPKDFFVFEDLPKGLSGKIQINEVKELINSQKHENLGGANDSYDTIIKEVASESFGISIDEITIADNSNTLEGWDSMGHLVFVTDLEKRFNVVFSTAEMITINSLAEAKRVLFKKIIN
jgi:acyl-coenzyme A synthetase/AMP-(fatty) acid ligase/acyl carrier protein